MKEESPIVFPPFVKALSGGKGDRVKPRATTEKNHPPYPPKQVWGGEKRRYQRGTAERAAYQPPLHPARRSKSARSAALRRNEGKGEARVKVTSRPPPLTDSVADFGRAGTHGSAEKKTTPLFVPPNKFGGR